MRWIIVLAIFFCSLVSSAQQVPTDTRVRMQQGADAFRARDFQRAVDIFNEVIAAEPQNIFAHNLAANCYLELGNYAAAAQSFQRALKIQPDQPQNLSGLARAYTWAGLTSERDELVKHIRELATAGTLPKDFGYVFDSFDVADKKVLVTEFPQLAGRYNFRYQFDVYDAAKRLTYRYALESDDVDQAYFREKHPDDAAAGKRSFSLDGYAGNTHATFKFYHDGEPSYAEARQDVEQALRGNLKAGISTTYTTAPKQPTPPQQAPATPK